MSDLEGLDKGPEQNTDGVALTQKFNQPSCPEKLDSESYCLIYELFYCQH